MVFTVGHAHAQVVYRFPVEERFLDGTSSPVSRRIVIVLEVVPDEELPLRLSTEDEAEAEGVE
jgi:hypothetical protein